MRTKIGEWIRRYLPAELAGTLGAVLAASTAAGFGNAAATAFAGSLGEAIAFYTVLLVRDLRANPRRVSETLRGLVMEFGAAEVADTLAIRPLAMYVGPLIVANAAAGVTLGKIAADLVFYTLAIIGYELRRSRDADHIPKREPAPVVRAKADDVVSDTFLAAFRRRDRYDPSHPDARPGCATRSGRA
jgi:hypothetical protein